MDQTVEYAENRHSKMKKKSKKNMNLTDDLQLFDDGDNHVETDGDNLKKTKKDKHMEKKIKSKSKEDGETNGDNLKKKKSDKHREKKRKLESIQDADEDQHDKGNLVYDDLQKKIKKRKIKSSSDNAEIKENEPNQNTVTDEDYDTEREKKKINKKKEKKKIGSENSDTEKTEESTRKKLKRKKRSSEVAEIKENDLGQNDGPDVEGPKPEKKKINKKKKNKKNKKIDGESLDDEKTDESTLKTRDLEEKKMKKQKVKVKGGKVKDKTNESKVENDKKKRKSKLKSKRVSFSSHVEVFPTSDTEQEQESSKGDGLIRGKRFTPEEDEILKQAVLDYVSIKCLGEEGIKMVLNCRAHKQVRGCWKEIGVCLPHRPFTAVYYRAHILFERAETRSWTQEEIEMLRELYNEHGNDWKKIGEELGKHRLHVKDTWRRIIKLDNLNTGKWSQQEYQDLYDLVNLDIQLKVTGEAERISKHGMLRDNIPWTAISDKLTTRSVATCCTKWYDQLTSSLVAEKLWSDADDYRMIGSLYEIDAACVEDVDWDSVLEHRSGEICLKRWNQMVRCLGDYKSKSFGEQVDILATRYCPDLAEIREEWDNRPLLP